jgi:hypothetical protein
MAADAAAKKTSLGGRNLEVHYFDRRSLDSMHQPAITAQRAENRLNLPGRD